MVDALLVCGLAKLDILIFPVIRTLRMLDNLTDLLIAAAHRLVKNLVTTALLQHLENATSPGLGSPIAWLFNKSQLRFPKQKVIACIGAWTFLCVVLALGSFSSRSPNQKINLNPLANGGKTLKSKTSSRALRKHTFNCPWKHWTSGRGARFLKLVFFFQTTEKNSWPWPSRWAMERMAPNIRSRQRRKMNRPLTHPANPLLHNHM
jgi:hypothetical protein